MPERPGNVLFLCTGNSARSILAEAWSTIGARGPSRATAPAAFPRARSTRWPSSCCADFGMPTGHLRSKSWDEFARPGAPSMDYVFTVCDQAAGEICPVWPGQPVTAHWGIPDPAAAEGSEAERMLAFRDAFRMLERRIQLFLALRHKELSHADLAGKVAEIGRLRDPS